MTDVELQVGFGIVDFSLPVHFHDSYQFDLLERGGRRFAFSRSSFEVGIGVMTVLHPGEAHSVRCSSETPNSFRTMHVSSAYLSEIYLEITGRHAMPWFDIRIDCPRTLYLYGVAHRSMEMDDHLGADAALRNLLCFLVLRHARIPKWEPWKASRRGVRRAREFIEDNISTNLRLDQLANVARMNKFNLVRLFSHEFGLAPHEYIIRSRIVRAREMLCRGVPVKTVAAELGFSDQSHFGRHFMKTTGLTPSHYQRLLQHRATANSAPQQEIL